MEKPTKTLGVAVKEFKDDLSKLLSDKRQEGVPYYIIEPIVLDFYRQIQSIAEKEITEEYNDYSKKYEMYKQLDFSEEEKVDE